MLLKLLGIWIFFCLENKPLKVSLSFLALKKSSILSFHSKNYLTNSLVISARIPSAYWHIFSTS